MTGHGRWVVAALPLALVLAGCATVGGGDGRSAWRPPHTRARGRPAVQAPVLLASAGDGVVTAPPAPAPSVEPLVQAFAGGRYVVVEQALDEAWALGRDDLALALLEASKDEALRRAVQTAEGRRLLDSLYYELTSDRVHESEAKQALRILAHRAQRIGLEAFLKATLSPETKVFPYRQSGITVLHSAALLARVQADGSIQVRYESAAYRGSTPEAHKLVVSPIRVEEDEVVGVRLYDEVGRLEYGPALMLLRFSNETKRRVPLKMAEMAALGLAASTGGVAVRASLLVWCDRAAMALGVVSMVLDEHRGWILERFGEDGARFLFYSDTLGSAVALYGIVRVVTAAPALVRGLRDSLRNLKARQRALNAAEREAFRAVESETEGLLRSLDDLSRQPDNVIPIEQARKPVPAVSEEPLRATGTDGPLVPRRPGVSEPTVASARRGAGQTEPLRAAPPSESRQATPSRAVPVRLQPAPVEDAEVLASKFAEAEATFSGPRYPADPKELVKYRPHLERPAPGMDRERWTAYVDYWHRRYHARVQGPPDAKAPLTPQAYEELATVFTRGIEHERRVAQMLVADAARPVARRELLQGMKEPWVEMHVGVAKEGVAGTRYVDQLVVDLASLKTGKPHVEVFSCKSRKFAGLDSRAQEAVLLADIDEVMLKYGRRIVVRRPGHPLFEQEIEVAKVHLVYEAELVAPTLRKALVKAADESRVEVHFR